MNYIFYGWKNADVKPINNKYEKITSPKELHNILSDIWCEQMCAPRMRKDNRTWGQCSITAFLIRDIFVGKVYGILRPDGSYHCYNAAGDC